MVLEIVHLILLTATLACGVTAGSYAHRIQAAEERCLAFQNGCDSDQRRYRLETGNLQRGWQKELRDWLGDSHAILDKLHSIAVQSALHAVAAPRSTPTLAPGSARPVPWIEAEIEIETKSVCRECDAGFVAVCSGGIGPCYVCEGSGFIHAV